MLSLGDEDVYDGPPDAPIASSDGDNDHDVRQ